MNFRLHTARHCRAHFIVLQAPFFVADAPEYYAWVVAVAQYHISQYVKLFLVHAELAALVYNQDAKLVAEVQHCRRSGVVRAAYGVESVLLELLQTVAPKLVWHADTDSGVVQMQVAAFQLERLSVQQEAVFSVELNVPQSESAAIGGRQFAVVEKGDFGGVQVGIGG